MAGMKLNMVLLPFCPIVSHRLFKPETRPTFIFGPGKIYKLGSGIHQIPPHIYSPAINKRIFSTLLFKYHGDKM